MTKSILHYKGLYGDLSKAGIPTFFHWEELATRSTLYDWEIKEHTHEGLYQLFWIVEGSGELVSGRQHIHFEGPCLISIPPNHFHGFSFEPHIKGEVLSISQDYIEKYVQEYPNLWNTIQEIQCLSGLKHEALYESLALVKQQFVKEWQDDSLLKNLAMKSLFLLFMTYFFRLNQAIRQTHLKQDNRTLVLFQKFKKLAREHLTSHLPIGFYAEKLAVSQVHLNRICQQVVAQSPHQVIEELLVNEAKNYLLNSSYSISEIAYLFNFKDPAYFTRVFRKWTGVSPREFQRS